MSVHWERAKLFPNRGCDGCSKISCVHHGSRHSNKQPPVDKHGNELPVPDGDRNGCNTLKGWTLDLLKTVKP